MRLDQLTLTNFRGFESLEISFDPDVTVLLGGNMSGKTAVLDGAAVALSEFLEGALHRVSGTRQVTDGDVRKVVTRVGGVPELQPQAPVAVGATGRHANKPWSRRSDRESSLVSDLVRRASEIVRALRAGGDEPLPVLALYGAKRLWWAPDTIEIPTGVGARVDGYEGCFDVGTSQERLVAWMKKQTLVQLQRGNGYRQPQLAAVEAAVRACVGDVTRFWYDVEYDELRLERGGGDLQTFGMLSDGYRNMVALVADLAWRASVLNPQLGPEAHLHAEGVAMIDEIELHLHPSWQRRVLDDLRRTFPRLQLIVTTHSPQVVASVARSQVRLLADNRLVASDLHVEGRDSNALLEDIFGVPARPAAAQAELDALYRLIEDADYAGARAALAALTTRLGPDDAQIVRARWILDTEAADPAPPRAAAP